MSKKPSPGKLGHRHSNRHSPTTSRWAKRKAQEHADSVNRQIDDVAQVGSRRALFFAHLRMARARSDKALAERKMLETTSLGDLIK